MSDEKINYNMQLVRHALHVRASAPFNQNRQEFLMNLAEENCLDGIPGLMKFFDLSFIELLQITDNSLEMLMSDTCGPLDFKYKDMRWEVMKKSGGGRRLGMVCQSRICPNCLRENLRQSISFHSSLPIACPTHGVMPLDFCPNCKSTLTYLRKCIDRCDCGYHIGNASAFERPPWLTTLYSIFAPWHLTRSNIKYNREKFFEREYVTSRLILYVLNNFEPLGGCDYINSNNFEGLRLLLSDFPESIWRRLERIDRVKSVSDFFGRKSQINVAMWENPFLRAIVNNYVSR